MAAGFRELLGISRRVPDTTLRDLLVRYEPASLSPLLHRTVRTAHRRQALLPEDLPFGVLSLDGKSITVPSVDAGYCQRHGDATEGDVHGLLRSTTAVLTSSRARPCIDVTPVLKRIATSSPVSPATDWLLRSGYWSSDATGASKPATRSSTPHSVRIRARGSHTIQEQAWSSLSCDGWSTLFFPSSARSHSAPEPIDRWPGNVSWRTWCTPATPRPGTCCEPCDDIVGSQMRQRG
jgi:hypothetical protein